MTRAVPHSTRLLLVSATALALASIAWGAAAPPKAPARAATTAASKPRAHAAKTPVAAKSSTTRVVKKSAVAQAPVAGADGMRIFKDPETGAIGPPTDANVRALAAESAPQRDITNLPQVKLANGGYELLIDGAIEDAVVMQIDKKGNRVVRCVTDPKTALKQTPPAPAREDR